MERPFWNIEFTPAVKEVEEEFPGDLLAQVHEKPTQILAYYSLAGRRIDHPNSTMALILLQESCLEIQNNLVNLVWTIHILQRKSIELKIFKWKAMHFISYGDL